MAFHNDIGNKGEELAVNYLLAHNYTILERNWRYRKAEIDIIARKDDLLIIVEVKTRSSLAFGNPEKYVTQKKIKRLVEATDAYVNALNLDLEVRFDIISIHKNMAKYDIRHITDAFLFF